MEDSQKSDNSQKKPESDSSNGLFNGSLYYMDCLAMVEKKILNHC